MSSPWGGRLRGLPWAGFGRLALASLLLVGAQALAFSASGALGALLTAGERESAWLLATGAASLVAGVAWPLVSLVLKLASSRLGRWGLAVLGAGLSAWLLWALTAGRWASRQPWRLPLVLLGAMAAAALLGRGLSPLRSLCARRPAVVVLGGAALLLLLTWLDVRLLPRAYPAFHGGVQCLAALGAGLSLEALLGAPLREGRSPSWLRPLASGVPFLLLGGGLWFGGLRAASVNARVVLEERGGWVATGLLFTAIIEGQPEAASEETLPGSAAGLAERAPSAGLPLSERSLLLVTVDALRADVLASYGGDGGATPHMDALAAESVRFERAYTPTPHTSYAIASLLSGTYAREVLDLEGKAGRFGHETLAEVLRRYGVRTAAFYPPAVFFVDGERFAPLRERGLGFEYRKEMFASARERVAQLDAYLREVAGQERPLFVWVHFFEPHEPYEPPAGRAFDETDRGRYLGEVAVVDEAVGALVRRFRAARPGATVILTADHGEAFGEHGSRYHGSSLYEEQARVPLLWSAPGVLRPAVLDVPVDLPDLATSWLSALALPQGPRMTGDDLVPCMRGRGCAERVAFGSLDGERMAVGARHKLLCRRGTALCRLFDLQHDPSEQLDLAASRPEVAARLRIALRHWLAKVPDVEAAALTTGVGWPEVLARAQLGDAVSPEALLRLLRDERERVRAVAARLLGRSSEPLGEGVERVLEGLAQEDPSESVRLEAAVALARHGLPRYQEELVRFLSDTARHEARRHRIAVALAHLGDRRAAPVLREVAFDRRLPEAERREAIAWLGRLRDRSVESKMIRILFDEEEVRLRDVAAEALGRLGGERAARALRRRLREEPYEAARRAEERALARIGGR